MAGGTHVFDMIKKLRENNALKEKGYFKTKDSVARKSDSIDLNYKIATDEEKEKILIGVIEESEKEARRSLKVLLISVLATGILVLLILLLVTQVF